MVESALSKNNLQEDLKQNQDKSLTSKLATGCVSFLAGFFRPVWFGIFIFWLFISLLVVWIRNSTEINFKFAIDEIFRQEVAIARIWQEVTIFIFLDYILDFSFSKKYPQIRYFIFLTVLVTISFFIILLIPYLQEIL